MKLAILGCRGIPARHGGFETFAEQLALYLVQRGWQVSVYCQDEYGVRKKIFEEVWNGVRLIHVPVKMRGAAGTIYFDAVSTLHASREDGIKLTLGYNTALFTLLYRARGKKSVINMDGIEWQRAKWSFPEKVWLYMNERLGCLFAHHLIADHPGIKDHLATRIQASKITTIPYGAESVTSADESLLKNYGIRPGGYALVIARPEPENSILEIVSAFSEKKRGVKLVVLGDFNVVSNAYHSRVKNASSDEVVYPGAVYDKHTVKALRFFACLYCHGHQVGGTNPSLVEALAAGTPVLAHDNPFNRWVCGPDGVYFKSRSECEQVLGSLLYDRREQERLSNMSRERHAKYFTCTEVLKAYEALLLKWC